MRILQLCKKFPYPLKDGESVAVTQLSRALNQLGCELTLLVMNTSKHYVDLSKLPLEYNHYKKIHSVEVYNHINFLGAAKNLFSKHSYHISRFISPKFEEKLIEILQNQQFDIIKLETFYLTPYISTIRKYSNAKIVMRSHNVEHEIWARVAEEINNPFKKAYLKFINQKLKKYEIATLNDYDILAAVSARDLSVFKQLGLKKEDWVIPIAMDTAEYIGDDGSFKKPLKICYIGSLDWIPNQEGLLWFLENVMPDIKTFIQDLTLHIAGRNMPKKIANINGNGVENHGEVENAIDFINQHPVMIVPLFSGSGMRVKILEGMALGKTIITTNLGLEGIDAIDNQHVIVANDKEEFIKAIQFCNAHPEKIWQIGQNASQLVQEKYDAINIAKMLIENYYKISGKNIKIP